MDYNYRLGSFPDTDCPVVSSFVRSEDGDVFYTYSAYARGLENLLRIYNLLDLIPKARRIRVAVWNGLGALRVDSSFVDPYTSVDPVVDHYA